MAEYKIGGYKIPDIYQGGYSSFDSSNNYITAGTMGMTTDPRVANILQEVSTKLSSGVKQIEISAVSPEVFDAMPKQHLKEVNRLSKLTGIDVSLHAPVMDVSGIDPRSGFSESERELSERKVTEALLRAKELDPDGNIPVTFHSAEGIPGSQFLPPSERKEEEKHRKLIVVNKETGKMAPLEPEIEYYPGTEKLKPERRSPEQRRDTLNKTEWGNRISQLIFNKERADELLEKSKPFIEHLIEEIETGKFKEEDFKFSPDLQRAYRHYENAQAYLHDLHTQTSSLFSRAYEFGNEHQKEILKAYSENFGKNIKKDSIPNPVSKDKEPLPNPFVQAQAMHELIHGLKRITPEMYVPVEEFAVEKSSQTFGNAAFNAYKKFKDKAPTLVIENPPAGFALSTGEDIKNMVEESRKHFVKKAVSDGMSESQAKKEAEKIIGATWDVGHINMGTVKRILLRRQKKLLLM